MTTSAGLIFKLVLVVALVPLACSKRSEPPPPGVSTDVEAGRGQAATSGDGAGHPADGPGDAPAASASDDGERDTVEGGEPELVKLPAIQPKYPAAAVRKAGRWLALFDPQDLRFDAAIGLASLRAWVDTPELERAYENALPVARREADNPLLPLAGVDRKGAANAVLSWTAPAAAAGRVDDELVIAEATHCKAHGLRDQTLEYMAGPMRDDGGHHTAHAAWALVLARERDCVPQARFEVIAGDLRAELARALAGADAPRTTREIELLAERMLMLALLDLDPRYLTASAVTLIQAQRPDGSWAIPKGDGDGGSAGEPPYDVYRATLMSAWSLAVLMAAPVPE